MPTAEVIHVTGDDAALRADAAPAGPEHGGAGPAPAGPAEGRPAGAVPQPRHSRPGPADDTPTGPAAESSAPAAASPVDAPPAGPAAESSAPAAAPPVDAPPAGPAATDPVPAARPAADSAAPGDPSAAPLSFGPPPPDAAPPAGRHEAHPPRLRRVVAAAVAAVLLVAVGGTAAWAAAGDVPRGTRVLGVDLGAMSRAEAERALGDRFGAVAARPVPVDLDGRRVEVRPADVGLALDVPATVARAADGGPWPFGRRDVAPVVRLDQAKLAAVLGKGLDKRKVTLKKPGIRYDGLTPRPTYPAPGRVLDPAAAADAVRGGWLTGAPVAVRLVERPPVTDRAGVDKLVAELARPAVAAPVTVRVSGRTVTLAPRDLAAATVFRSDAAGRLTAAVDGGRLRSAAKEAFAAVETPPRDATVKLQDGRPVPVAGVTGRLVDTAALARDVLAVLGRPAPREVTATLATAQPERTDAEVAKFGVKTKVSTFTTYFTGGADSPRSRNIATVAREVDGALVAPGETFSLNGHTGPRDYAGGYADAPVIVDGKLEPGVAGGASQFTTTLFNAAYYAGLQDVEHKPHSFYFDRYPAVIESTIFYPTLDLKFKNTTPYGVLIDTSTTGRSVTVTLWSTKVYDSVRTERSPRRNVTSPPTVYREPGPKCIASQGLPGFTQDAWRIIRKGGREVAREKFTWRYDPEPRFVCGEEPR